MEDAQKIPWVSPHSFAVITKSHFQDGSLKINYQENLFKTILENFGESTEFSTGVETNVEKGCRSYSCFSDFHRFRTVFC